MSKIATPGVLAATALLGLALSGSAMGADWRHLGNSVIDLSLAGLASGPVERVWYSADGGTLYARTQTRRVFGTKDFETWSAIPGAVEPAARDAAVSRMPEPGVHTRAASPLTASALYAFGKYVYRSDDAGSSWDNLSAYREFSILGSDLRDLAISPKDSDEIAVAGAAGIFRSLDGGKSWAGLNQGLPNLPAARIVNLPSGEQGLQLDLASFGPAPAVIEWQPGEKQAWRPSQSGTASTEHSLKQALSLTRGSLVTAARVEGNTVYTGTSDGRISVSSTGGVDWQTFAINGGGAVEAFWVDPKDPRLAVAILGKHVLRTVNSGAFWDDITANLADTAAHGVTASRSSGAIYVATDAGVFYTQTDLTALGAPTPWKTVAGLPAAPVTDVKLDAGENQLWAAVESYGIYSTLAPHRLTDPRVVSSADYASRAAAPGALLSVMGARVESARAGVLSVPVLAASDTESQIQVPFDTQGSSLSLSIDGAGGRRALAPLPLESASPAIFVGRDGAPLLLDASTGVLLDPMNPAHSRARVQVLATGLGRVTPDWPAGVNAPLDSPPKVAAEVHAWLDRAPVDVTRAVLAPGYVGFYLVEIEIPKIVNYGPAELYIDAGGHQSNRVRVYIEP